MSIKMSFLKDSKDTFEAWFPVQNDLFKNTQIACLQKAFFNICGDSRGDKNHFSKHLYNPTVTIISPVMENTYGNFGEGVCFILDKENFEKENSFYEHQDIKYVNDNYKQALCKCDGLQYSNLTDSEKFKIIIDALSFKNASFEHENEQRFFCKDNENRFLSIKNSIIGTCIGQRMSNVYYKHYVDNGTFCSLYETFMRRIKDNNIDLFQTDNDFHLVQLNKDDTGASFRWRYVYCFGSPYYEDENYWMNSVAQG